MAGVASAFALGLVLCACPASPEPDGSSTASTGTGVAACKLADLGDTSQPIALDLVALGVDNNSMPIADGSTVPLITPPQGGRVIFVGVRATNLSPCGVKLKGSLKDPVSGQVMLDSRTVNLKVGADGYGSSVDSNISSFANIPVCPNQWSASNTFDSPYDVTVELEDQKGRKATKTISITPRCAEPGALGAECTCLCKLGYVLGQACP